MKTLIVCCDGTWNQPDQRGGPTNVTQLANAICPENDNGEVQIVYYDEGVGTGNWWDRLVGGSMGIGLSSRLTGSSASITCRATGSSSSGSRAVPSLSAA